MTTVIFWIFRVVFWEYNAVEILKPKQDIWTFLILQSNTELKKLISH